ncbi:phage tail protein [Clostridium sp. BNL1100]|uniref:phage tail protein n=1 Tax=Clostridium sp. BNL1100 TaxID=755731 RepID=UPI00024A7D9C|nr:phage tail protein [Clostridium sp. BNL1100]AEY64988.1 phage tail collar family protein [Clostridium sp. BNL1100]
MDCPILGMIKLFPFSYVPRGWAVCNGATINVQTNTALYSLLGIQFGGNGSTTFCLPNLTGSEPVQNTVYCIATEGIYPDRQ